MTLLTYHSSGGDQGRCDAKCYAAVTPHCTCICGGANHGKGLAVASDQTSRLAASWIERYKEAHPGETTEFGRPGVQTTLFDAR